LLLVTPEEEFSMKKFISSFILVTLLSSTALAGGTKDAQSEQRPGGIPVRAIKPAAYAVSGVTTGWVGQVISSDSHKAILKKRVQLAELQSTDPGIYGLGLRVEEEKKLAGEIRSLKKMKLLGRIMIPVGYCAAAVQMVSFIDVLYNGAISKSFQNDHKDKSVPGQLASAPSSTGELSSAPSARDEHVGKNF